VGKVSVVLLARNGFSDSRSHNSALQHTALVMTPKPKLEQKKRNHSTSNETFWRGDSELTCDFFL
jgi:hypothetical protein